MKKLICSLVVSMVMIATPGFAEMDWSAGKFGVSGGFISGDKAEVLKDQKADYEGVGIYISGDYQNNFNEQLGFNVGLGYGSQKIKDLPGDNFDYILLSSNLTYDVQSNIYVYGGLNVPLNLAKGTLKYTSSSTIETPGEVKYNGNIGFQVGSGYRFTNQFSVDLSYRVVNAEAQSSYTKTKNEAANKEFDSSNKESTGDVQIASSIQLAAKYTF